ncbi:MAG: hypothetical protein PUD86_02960 [Methanobacteriaceae archaeon]|nr:hypothetical protein [Methanobacteriaceae archaeon]
MHLKYVKSRNFDTSFEIGKLKNNIKSLAPTITTAIVNYKSSKNSYSPVMDIKYKTQFNSEDMINDIKTKLITEKTNKKSSNNYESNIYESNKLDSFLNSTFNIISDNNSLISYIIDKKLSEILYKLPNMIYESFNTRNLELCLENKYSDEKWVVIYIFTKLDGESASNELDLLEDNLCNKFGDDCLDNILISVEFE